ncbi:MAG TPA: HAMP domain-containing protein [Roseiflexaceae bacterium]|nr:HAMP domain-containing protein [Roseiflexaceae bacterium]
MLRTLIGKLSLGVALFLVLLAIITVTTIQLTITNVTLSNHLIEDTLQFVHRSDLFNMHTARALAETEAFVRNREGGQADEVREQIQAARAQLTTLEAILSHNDHTEAEQGANAALLRRQQQFLAETEQQILSVFEAIAANDEAALAEALEAIEEAEDQFAAIEMETTALLDQEAAESIDTMAIQNQQGLIVAPIGFGLLGLVALLTLWLLRQFIVRPIRSLSAAAGAVASGDLSQKVPVTSKDEIGELQASFNQMVSNLAAQRTQVVEQQQALQERASELEHTLEELQASTQERDQLSQSIRELSTPVLPLFNGILVMPLIGVIDTARSTLLMQTLLGATERYKATTVLLDVTGVPLIDTTVARGLLEAAQAIRLLGAQTILCGLRPELAQTITGLGLNLVGLVSQADLQSGLAYAMQRHR